MANPFSAASMRLEGLKEAREMFDVSVDEANEIHDFVTNSIAKRIATLMRKNLVNNSTVDTGVLKKAITARRGKPRNPAKPFSTVYIQEGKKAKARRVDGWYWHFIEYGTEKQQARPFIRPAIAAVKAEFTKLYQKRFKSRYNSIMKKRAKQILNKG